MAYNFTVQSQIARWLSFWRAPAPRALIVAPYVYADAADDQAVLNLIKRLEASRNRCRCVHEHTCRWSGSFSIAPAEAVTKALANTVVAAVGPVVAETLRKHGIEPRVMPDESFFLKPLTSLQLEEALGRAAVGT